MMRRSLPLFVALLLLLGFQATPPRAQEKPTRLTLTAKEIDSALGTDWYGVYVKNEKIGWFYSTRGRQGQGKDAIIRDAAAMEMKLVSMDQKIKLEMSQTLDYDAAPPYRLRRGEYVQFDGFVKQHIVVTAAGAGYDAVITTGKVVQKKTLPIDQTLEDALSANVWLQRKPKVGTSITTSDLDFETLKVELNTLKLEATKESLVSGVKVLFHEVENYSHRAKIKTIQRHDDKGRMLSGVLAGILEMRRETEAQAKNTAYSVDLFVMGTAKIDQPLGRTTRVTSLVLRAEGKELSAILKAGPLQHVEDNKDGSLTLKLGGKYARAVKATEAEIKEALEESLTYPITDERVKALAAKAVGDAKTPREKVERLIHFTHRYIRPSLSTTLPKALDLLDRKAGDCKSYALMFNTLARAAGIPAREVGGLVYMGDGVKAFGGHAWNEVVLDGLWVPVDASADEVTLDAAHIRLGIQQEAITNTAATIGKLTLKLVDVESSK